MKLIQITAAILFVVLLASVCSQRIMKDEDRDLLAAASAAVEARTGSEGVGAQIVQGIRERAVCGVTAGKRYVYRESGMLVVEGEIAAFDNFHTNWCVDTN